MNAIIFVDEMRRKEDPMKKNTWVKVFACILAGVLLLSIIFSAVWGMF